MGRDDANGVIKMEPKRPHTESQLAQDLRAYARRMKTVERERQDLTRRINEALRDEIIPKVEDLLPDHYSVDRDESYLMPPLQVIDPYFGIELRILYDDKPIYKNEIEKLGIARETLDSELRKMEGDYGLKQIVLTGDSRDFGPSSAN